MRHEGWGRHRRAAMAMTLSAAAVAAGVLGLPRLAAARPTSGGARSVAVRTRGVASTRRLAARPQPARAHRSAAPVPSPRRAAYALPDAVSSPLTARSVAPDPRVGALFLTTASGALSSHFCTATVVSSKAGDVIVTAAHCVYSSGNGGYVHGLAFVPGYKDGAAPYGVWLPSKTYVDPHWTASADPAYDVAFLRVRRGADTDLAALTGADRPAFSPAYRTLVRVIGYPGTAKAPVACDDYTSELSATQLRWNCAGYPAGTSGSPFLSGIDPATGIGTVGGVIGGYETGGDSPDASYSAYFGPAIAALYRQAAG